MKLPVILFIIGGSVSMIANPLSKNYIGSWNEYKRSILPGIGMDGEGAEDILELKRSRLERKRNNNDGYHFLYI